jgi:hypothetical protein
MLRAQRNRRKIYAVVLKAPVDNCLGVVACGLPGCEASAPIIAGEKSAGDQCDWFLDNHTCTPRPRKLL